MYKGRVSFQYSFQGSIGFWSFFALSRGEPIAFEVAAATAPLVIAAQAQSVLYQIFDLVPHPSARLAVVVWRPKRG